jgi:hypothetical protein
MAMSNKLVTAYDMIKARDETIDELSAEVERLTPYVVVAEWTKARAEAAERRVAELEARLADEWRPVTEPPIEEGEYWGWDAHDGVFITHYNPDRDYDDDWAWSDWSGEMIPVDMWSPSIPPPPPSNSTGLAP